jgi:hypothetical protein
VYCWLIPSAIVALPGLIEIPVNTGGVTDSVADPLTVPEDALMIAAPWATPTASPPLLTVADAVAEEVQVTVLLRFLVFPLL